MSRQVKHGSSLALVLDPQVITVFQVRPNGDRVHITGRWEIETPSGAVGGGVVRDGARLGQALRTLWRKSGLRERSVSAVIPPSAYSMRALRLPDLPAAERRAVVRGELEQNGGLPYGGGFFDFLWMRSAPESPAEVYAYHTSDAVVNSLSEALDEAGLRLRGMEPTSLATIRAYFSTLATPQPVVVLCPAERYSDLCIHDGHEIVFLRRIAAGWVDLKPGEQRHSYAGAPAYVGSTEEEPRSRRKSGLEATAPTAIWGDAQEGVVGYLAADPLIHAEPDPEMLPPAPNGQVERLVAPRERSLLEEEVVRSLAYYAREHQDRAYPATLVVTASGQTLATFEHLLSSIVPIPVVGMDLRQELLIPPAGSPVSRVAEDPDLLAAAVGAAAGAAGLTWGVPVVNPIGHESPKALGNRGRRKLVVVSLAGSAAVLAVAAAASGILTLLEMETQSEKARVEARTRQVEAERAPILRYHEISTAARSAREKTQIPISSVLGRVAAASNPNISLSQLQMGSDKRLSLQGRAMNTTSLEKFARDLAAGDALRLPLVESLQRSNQTVDFRITALTGTQSTATAGPAGEGG